jgi:hypothetical protein
MVGAVSARVNASIRGEVQIRNPVQDARNEAKHGEGRSRKRGPHTPVLNAMRRLWKARMNTSIMGESASDEAGRLVEEGGREYDENLHAQWKADDFLFDENLTIGCVDKKAPMVETTPWNSFWQIKEGVFQNISVEVPGGNFIYFPRKDSDVENNLTSFKKKIKDLAKNLNEIKHFDGNLKTDFRFLSVLFKDPKLSALAQLSEFTSSLPDTKVAAVISDAFKNMLVRDQPSFRFNDTYVRSFKTRHYTTHLCILSGLLSVKSNGKYYKVEVYRKMIIASVNKRSGDLPHHIPLCEEFFLQIRYVDKNKTSTYLSNGFYASGRFKNGDAETWNSTLSFMGDNAFCVEINPVIMRNQTVSETDEIMRFVGVIINHMKGVRSNDELKLMKTDKFFKFLFYKDGKKTKLHDFYQAKFDNPSDIGQFDVMKASFLSDKNACVQMAESNGKKPIIRIWMSSAMFAIVVISPAGNPSLNYTYVLFWGDQNKSTTHLEDDDSGFGLGSHMANPIDGFDYPESILPPDLELELSLL